jgi:hypothetical protein
MEVLLREMELPVKHTVPVSTRALVARLRRALQRKNRDLHATRGVEAKASLGDFYVVDLRRHHVVNSRVDIEALAKDLDCLRPHERLQA